MTSHTYLVGFIVSVFVSIIFFYLHVTSLLTYVHVGKCVRQSASKGFFDLLFNFMLTAFARPMVTIIVIYDATFIFFKYNAIIFYRIELNILSNGYFTSKSLFTLILDE